MKNNAPRPKPLACLEPFHVLLLLLTSVAPAPKAGAELMFYDGFDYLPGEELGATVLTSPPWENDKSQFAIVAGNLEYIGIQASAGNRVNVEPVTANLDSVRTAAGAWAEQSSGTLYFSFLLAVRSTNGIDAAGDGTSVLTLGRTSNNSQLIGINLLDSGGIRLGVLKYPSSNVQVSSAFFVSGAAANLSADGSTAYLVVGKYEWVDGADNDIVTVWVNPGNLGATEDPGNNVSTGAGTDGTRPAGRLTLSRGPHVSIDEIRIGQRWSDVTPTGGPLVASRLGFGNLQPVAFVGTTVHPVVVHVLNPAGVLVPTNGVPVTLSLTAGSGRLHGTLTRDTGADGRAIFDDLRFDTLGNGKEITATSGSLDPIAQGNLYVIRDPDGVAASPPVITQTLAAAGTVMLRGEGGAPNGAYQVVGSEDVTSPGDSWAVVAANTFDAQGEFSGTYPLPSGEPRQFYRLQAQGAGSGMFQHAGYASAPGAITGGGDSANIVVVTNLVGFMDATSDLEPRIVYVDGAITLRDNGNTYLSGNKTIIGLGADATLIGDVGIFLEEGGIIYNATNIILRNLTITNPDGYGEDDGITIKNGGRQVWVDHCTIHDCGDGLLDVTREGDFVTVSWCTFYYTAPNGHENVNLIGGSDDDSSDAGKLHVTFHHNWWGDFAKERMPSVRYGRAHVFNNYFNSPNNNYCTRTRLFAEVLVENNYYEGVYNPWELATSSAGSNGLLHASGNITDNCTFSTAHYDANLPNGGIVVLADGTDVLTPAGIDPLGLNPPPYAYMLDDGVDVRGLVTANAGAGHGPFAP